MAGADPSTKDVAEQRRSRRLAQIRDAHRYAGVLGLVIIVFTFSALAPDSPWTLSVIVVLQAMMLALAMWTGGRATAYRIEYLVIGVSVIVGGRWRGVGGEQERLGRRLALLRGPHADDDRRDRARRLASGVRQLAVGDRCDRDLPADRHVLRLRLRRIELSQSHRRSSSRPRRRRVRCSSTSATSRWRPSGTATTPPRTSSAGCSRSSRLCWGSFTW